MHLERDRDDRLQQLLTVSPPTSCVITTTVHELGGLPSAGLQFRSTTLLGSNKSEWGRPAFVWEVWLSGVCTGISSRKILQGSIPGSIPDGSQSFPFPLRSLLACVSVNNLLITTHLLSDVLPALAVEAFRHRYVKNSKTNTL